MANEPSQGTNDPYASIRYPEFKFFLIIRFAVVFALTMQFAIIEWRIYHLTNDPLSLGLIGLAEVVPALIMALFAGHIVDKREKRGVMMKCMLAYIVVGIGLFLLTWDRIVAGFSAQSIAYSTYALVFVGGIIRSFVGPSTFTMLSLLVPRELYKNAATWSSSSWQVGGVMGPAIGGLCIYWFGVHWSMLLVVGMMCVPVWCLLNIQPKPIYYKDKGESVFQSLGAGLKFVWNTKVVLNAMALDMFAVLFGGSKALLAIFATTILGVGSLGYGFLSAAPAVGSLLTMFVLAYRPLVKKPGIKLLAAVFGFGLCMIVFAISKSYILSLTALLVSGMLDGISVIVRQTILQLKTPDDMRGRVASVSQMFVGSSNELGAFESGLAAKIMGVVPSVVFGGCMTLGVVITTYIISPAMRKLDLKP
ncbi:Na+/melibiose symporter-like transporter [Chitinophaga skermanii]|uniref:Na+/melibiose symporter-like transporter n=1 Tax=Chitinophaga skermanii TaxID=331697 RepID=A0A327Q7L2_9BACT|nr:MFS transporter [Chitinophaga skermanii]RAJ00291.1 Na+/melibiose symporter-like transporter [Chitinophaga skermanii]